MRFGIFIGGIKRVFTIFTGGIYAGIAEHYADLRIVGGDVFSCRNIRVIHYGGNGGVVRYFTVRNFMGTRAT